MNLQGASTDQAGRAGSARALAMAVLASLALHAAVFLPSSWPMPRLAAGIGLTARLVGEPTQAGARERATPGPAAQDPPAVEVAGARVLDRGATGAAAGRSPRAKAPAGARTDADGVAARASSVPRAPVAGGGEAALSGDEPISEQEDAAGSEALRAYRFGLAGALAARYPARALEQRWSGTTEVRLEVAGSGTPAGVRVARSSGHAVLDAEAVAMVSRAARKVAVPEILRGREFALRVPVRFDLPETE